MSVTERREDFPVERPSGVYTHLSPFSIWEAPRTGGEKAPLIVLNTALHSIDIRALWAASSVQVCADGGANRLYGFFDTESERSQFIPLYITGDLDSLKEEVREYYTNMGSVVIPQFCQYSTDFMKAIKVVVLYGTDTDRHALSGEIEQVKGLNKLVEMHTLTNSLENSNVTVNVAGGIGGRFDQTIQLINQMYAINEEFPWVHLVFFTSQDVIFMAPKGRTYVSYSHRSVFNTMEKVPKCGLLPFGRKTVLNTRGLLYDVDNWPSEIGGQVSSSNGVCGTNGFLIETTENIVVNIEVGKIPPRLDLPTSKGRDMPSNGLAISKQR